MIVFGLMVVGGLGYITSQLWGDISVVHSASVYPYILLGIALLIALGFEFVNGFHDTANAVATCIYTHSLEPHVAVVYSGILNFIGVLLSSGTVAYAVITLLPVELILKVPGRGLRHGVRAAGRGDPVEPGHLVQGPAGLQLAHHDRLDHRRRRRQPADAGQQRHGRRGVGPGEEGLQRAAGFAAGGLHRRSLIFLLFKLVARDPRLYKAPEGTAPPPLWIRILLICTCGGVSYAHGSNDGQKGMGLIMLILVGTVPTAYALNHAVTQKDVDKFMVASTAMVQTLDKYVDPNAVMQDEQPELEKFLSTKTYEPAVMLALRQEVVDIRNEVTLYGSLKSVPPEMQANVRNQMYLSSAAMTMLAKKGPNMTAADTKALSAYKAQLDLSTKFIPTWVKVAVALALGLGTMIGWKRIVVTVGEKIGKTHLTYAQGASAELVAMATILAADRFGLPVSTTHVLSSGVAGTMAANKSGLQMSTIRSIAAAWVFTLPAAAILSGCLFWLFSSMVR